MLERLPNVALAQGLVATIKEATELNEREKRILIGRFSEILRPVCKATEEAYEKGFDAGSQWQAGQK